MCTCLTDMYFLNRRSVYPQKICVIVAIILWKSVIGFTWHSSYIGGFHISTLWSRECDMLSFYWWLLQWTSIRMSCVQRMRVFWSPISVEYIPKLLSYTFRIFVSNVLEDQADSWVGKKLSIYISSRVRIFLFIDMAQRLLKHTSVINEVVTGPVAGPNVSRDIGY